uniref:Uncharacterized protein n=1 Tax=Amphimedon queenslandica TaxID=400682 RepID=A0A1X7VI97_AMPQE
MRRQRQPVDYKEESSSVVNTTSDHEVEESSGSSSEKEYTCKEQAPDILDTALLQGIPDVLMSLGDLPIVVVEGNLMKEIPSKDASESDVGQLLFYVMGSMIKLSYKEEQHILGILIQGNSSYYVMERGIREMEIRLT